MVISDLDPDADICTALLILSVDEGLAQRPQHPEVSDPSLFVLTVRKITSWGRELGIGFPRACPWGFRATHLDIGSALQGAACRSWVWLFLR
jgi:hypothetical protein